jgi:hypothetical protein
MYSNAPILAVALLSQLVAAQTTTSAPAASGSSLPDLVGQIDDCVLRCISNNSDQLGCEATDFECLCQVDSSTLTSSLISCVTQAGCIEEGLGEYPFFRPSKAPPLLIVC